MAFVQSEVVGSRTTPATAHMATSHMTAAEAAACVYCPGPLIEIDHCADRLVGCFECNRWSCRGSERVTAERVLSPAG